MLYSPMGAQTIRVCTLATPLEFTHGRHMCNLVMVIGPHLVCIEWLLPLLPWVGGAFCYSFRCAPTNWWGLQPWGSIESHPIHPPSLHDGEESSFPGLLPSYDAVNSDSVMDVKPGDSGMVIGHQVDEFTHT